MHIGIPECHLIIHIESKILRGPFHCIDIPVLVVADRLLSGSGLVAKVVGVMGMYCLMNDILLTDMLHNVDLTAVRPTLILIFLRHHPDRREGSVRGLRQPCPALNPAECESEQALGLDSGRLVLPVHDFRIQDKHSILYIDLVITLGHLVVPVAASLPAEGPLCFIRPPVDIELIPEDIMFSGLVEFRELQNIL